VACDLQRRGTLALVEQHLAAADLSDRLPLWIAALVIKLGPAPTRGWRLPASCWTSAAVLAGTNLLSSQSLVRFCDDPAARWKELTRGLMQHLADAETSLIAAPYGHDGMALLRADVLGPVWVGDTDELAGITPGPPTDSSELSAAIEATIGELASRTACPLAVSPDLDRHLATVAGWSVARLGHALWPTEFPPVPLVFARLASLEAQVRRDEDGFSARVPLGKRHRDLSRAGWLADIPRVPWLDGSIRFRGG
jgi:hypothetical protein